MNDRRRIFINLSSELTGYSVVELEGTGLVDSYHELLGKILGPKLSFEFYHLAEAMMNLPDTSSREQGIRDLFFPSNLWPLLSSLIALWYLGSWIQLPDSWYAAMDLPVPGPGDPGSSHTPSELAYIEQLSYRTAGAHTPGAKPTGFASWSIEPVQ